MRDEAERLGYTKELEWPCATTANRSHEGGETLSEVEKTDGIREKDKPDGSKRKKTQRKESSPETLLSMGKTAPPSCLREQQLPGPGASLMSYPVS